MKTLSKYIVENARAARSGRGLARENTGDVQTMRSLDLNAATVAFPAGIRLEERAARMNSFWEKLVDFQDRDVLVVALCSSRER